MSELNIPHDDTRMMDLLAPLKFPSPEAVEQERIRKCLAQKKIDDAAYGKALMERSRIADEEIECTKQDCLNFYRRQRGEDAPINVPRPLREARNAALKK